MATKKQVKKVVSKNQPKKVVSKELPTDNKYPGHTTRAFRD